MVNAFVCIYVYPHVSVVGRYHSLSDVELS